jgi:hypothetical protein
VVDVPGVELHWGYEQRLVLRNRIYLVKDDSHCALATYVDKVPQGISSEAENWWKVRVDDPGLT